MSDCSPTSDWAAAKSNVPHGSAGCLRAPEVSDDRSSTQQSLRVSKMERMLVVLADNPGAAGAGLVAMVCFAIWPLFRARTSMLMAYIGNNLAFVVHYALLGHWTA